MKDREQVLDETLGLLVDIQRLAKRLTAGNVSHDSGTIVCYTQFAIENLESITNVNINEKNSKKNNE